MAKRQCDPTSGSIGLQTYQQGRNGQTVRTRAIPVNPRTSAQRAARAALTVAAQAWRTLTDAGRAAWEATASAVKSRPRLAQYGMLTGEQLFCRINASLQAIGADTVTTVPDLPSFPKIPITGLVITNVGGVAALKLTAPSAPQDGTMCRVSKPVSQGIMRAPRLALVGILPSPVGGSCDITSLYTAKYGNPPAGRRVFVSVNNNIDGWEDLPLVFSAVVPASS